MLNKVQLIGHLGGDPDMRHTPGGAGVCEFSIATTEKWTDKEGNKKDETEWHRIKLWGKLGEIASKYLHKGSKVYVEGRIKTRSWDDKDGHKRYMTEIVASEIKFLDSKPGGDQGRNSRQGLGSTGAPSDFGGGPDDDIPF